MLLRRPLDIIGSWSNISNITTSSTAPWAVAVEVQPSLAYFAASACLASSQVNNPGRKYGSFKIFQLYFHLKNRNPRFGEIVKHYYVNLCDLFLKKESDDTRTTVVNPNNKHRCRGQCFPWAKIVGKQPWEWYVKKICAPSFEGWLHTSSFPVFEVTVLSLNSWCRIIPWDDWWSLFQQVP